jgi:hypothetical protein
VTPQLPPNRRKLLATILTPLFVFVALASWSLASPVGASPDDDFHLASIWCGDGLRSGLCERAQGGNEREVPVPLRTAACYAYKADQSASCQGAGFKTDTYMFESTARGNWTGDYPPVFYAVMGLFAGPNISLSVMLMRVFNVCLFVGLSMAVFLLLPRCRRPALVWGFAITLVPLGMFLIPSTNPSSWAVISAGTLWISLLGYMETTGWRKLGLGLLAVVSTVLGVGARADAAVYTVIAIGAVVVLSARRDRRLMINLLLPLGLIVLAAWFFLSAGQSSFAASGLPSSGGQGPNWKQLLFLNALNVPTLWAGALGLWGLGWLDTALPSLVWVSTLAVFCALTFTGLKSLGIRKILAVAGIFAALWAIPSYILLQSRVFVGTQVQPRYILPLMVLLAGVTLLQSKGRVLEFGRGQASALAAALIVANSVALHFNIRRYVTGVDVTSWNLDSGVEWWWGIPFSPMAVWLIGTLSFASAVVVISPAIWSKQSGSRLDGERPVVTTGQPRYD